MTYISYSGCCSGFSGSLSIRETTKIYRSLDVVMSGCSDFYPVVSALETAAAREYKPLFFETAVPEQITDARNDYRKMDVGAAIRYAAYSGNGRNAGYFGNTQTKTDVFSPDIFLNRDRPASQFIGSVDDIKHYIREAFEKTAGKMLPDDIIIRVVGQNELKGLHEEFGGKWSPGIQGISINKRGFGQSMIFVKENDLDMLLVTVGHEIGHVINFPLAEKLNEEAKAFAFEMAWVNALYSHNIAGLRKSINPNPMPARNGLHDVAFAFVKNLLLNGMKALDIFAKLMKNEIRMGGENALLR